MGYFEGLASGSFKKNKDGNTVFFPWGMLSKGRVLPDESTETKLRGFLIHYYKVCLPTIIGVGVIIGWLWAFLLAPIFSAWFYFGTKSLTSGCPYSEEKLTFKEGYTNSAASHNKLTLWLLFFCSLLFVLAGIFIAVTAESSDQMMLGWFTAVLFGACGVAFGYMLKVKHA